MLRNLILKRIDAEERALGVSLENVRHIARTSLPAFAKYALFTPLSRHRRKLPVAPYYVARIVASRDEDCGTCVQIEVNLARKESVPAEILRAVLDRRPDALPLDLADVYRFAEAVVAATGEEEPLRARIRERYGEEALVELALGMASARFYPVTKRVLGYAKSCALVKVEV